MAEYDVSELLEDTTARLAGDYIAAFRDYLVARVVGNAPQEREARLRLYDVVREGRGKGEVLGALSALRTAARAEIEEGVRLRARRENLIAFANTPARKVLSRVTFAEALEDLVERVPVTLRGAAERSALNIAKLYEDASGRGVIGFARAAEASVTKAAQRVISRGVREGIPEREIGRSIAFSVNRIREETEAWTEAYGRMVFRTNLGDAVSKGRQRVAQDPDVRELVPGLRFSAVGDKDTRPNHKAADGVILRADNPAWEWLRPPIGYGCRCEPDLMTRPELRRMGRIDKAGKLIESKIPAGARPDEGFRSGGPS